MLARWILLGLECLLVSAVQAATWYVKTNGNDSASGSDWANAWLSISNGVGNASVAAPDIVLVSNGIYKLAAQVSIAKGISVKSVNGRDATFVDGNYPATTNRCFSVTHANAVLDGFTITNGAVLSGGGGVIMSAGTVRNCTINRNRVTSDTGGGVYITGGVLSNCTVNANTNPARSGGGIAINGGIVKNCIIASNVAGSGGGIFFFSTSTAYNCTISANTASDYRGGAVAMAVGTFAVGLDNCLIERNVATNSSSQPFGGAIYVVSPTTLRSCTIVSNFASTGGGIIGEKLIVVQNTIVYFNASGGNWVDWAGISFSNCCFTPALTGASTNYSTNNITANPMLANIPVDYHLLRASPCRNTGLNQDWMTNALDLEGHLRIWESRADMGAYEWFPKGTIFRSK